MIPNSTKDASKLGVTLFKRETWSFCCLNLMNLSNPSGNWLISIYVIKTIETEWVQCQNKHWQQISKADTSNYTKTIIYLTLTEYYTMILTVGNPSIATLVTRVVFFSYLYSSRHTLRIASILAYIFYKTTILKTTLGFAFRGYTADVTFPTSLQ